jgi:hypothetical protein
VVDWPDSLGIAMEKIAKSEFTMRQYRLRTVFTIVAFISAILIYCDWITKWKVEIVNESHFVTLAGDAVYGSKSFVIPDIPPRGRYCFAFRPNEETGLTVTLRDKSGNSETQETYVYHSVIGEKCRLPFGLNLVPEVVTER